MKKPHLIQLLREHCVRQNVARVMIADPSRHCQARFVAVTPEELTLDVLACPRGVILGQSSWCAVSFDEENRRCLFLSSILKHGLQESERPLRVVVSTPSELFAAESRAGFRIPLGTHTRLLASVTASGRVLQARPINISMFGILIEFAQNGVPDLTIDEELHVRLQLGDSVAEVKGVVRRRDRTRYGLFFPDVVEIPSPPMRGLIDQLETTWSPR